MISSVQDGLNSLEVRVFSVFPPNGLSPPSRNCSTKRSVFVFWESVDSAHNSQISSNFQEANCLLKLVKVNKQVFAIISLKRNLKYTAQLSLS